MNGFYLTLPSNSSYRYFPDNKVNNFITKLPQTLALEGRWEVGLVEFQWPNNWYNLKENNGYVNVILPDDQIFKVDIPCGFYSSPVTLVNKLNNRISKAFDHEDIRFIYEGLTRKVSLNNVTNSVVELSKSLKEILGFKNEVLDNDQCGNCAVDMRHGINSLYVYSDVVEHRIVGDASVPLLRTVPAIGKAGDIQAVTFTNVYYLPVSQRNFDSIRVYICDDTGELVSFEGGRSIVTLHFRRIPVF